jgi:hypothetical protein
LLNWLLLMLPLALLLTSCGNGASDAVKPKDQDRFGSTSSSGESSTIDPPTFTALSSITTTEGSTVTSVDLSCTSNDDSLSDLAAAPSYSVTQTNSYSGCRIQTFAGVSAIICNIDYYPGHANWISQIYVHCTINDLVTTNTFDIDVTDTNRAPALTAVGNQTLYVENPIASIDMTDGDDDYDADLEAITYSCAYEGNGDPAGTACSSLPSTYYSFNTTTGALSWTPSIAAGSADGSDTDYNFTITGTDPYAATGTETFTITIQNIAPPVYVSMNPVSPSNTNSSPQIKGTAAADVVTLYFYRDPNCYSAISNSSKASFTSGSSTLGLNANTTTTIYAVAKNNAGHKSACTYMTDYTHDALPSDDPVFVSISPVSPTSSSTSPTLIGTIDDVADTIVNLYSDSGCSNLLGSGDKAQWEGAGIATSGLTSNDLTTIYGQGVDNLSQKSNCVLMTNYRHDDIAPTATVISDNVIYNNSTTATPTISWTPPSTDSGSGLSHYLVSVGSTSGSNDVVDWTNVGDVALTVLGGTFVNGSTYYASVKAVDLAGNMTTITSSTTSDGWTIETSAPADLAINAISCGRFDSGNNLIMGAGWDYPTDTESGIATVEYAIGTTSGDTDTIGWTDVTGTSSLTLSSASFATSTTYHLTVKATNNAGQSTAANTSTTCSDVSSSLISFWTFDHGSDGGGDFNDSITTDSSTNQIITGNATTTTGVVGNALDFDGIGQGDQLGLSDSGDESDYRWYDNSSFSISLWIKLDDISRDHSIIGTRISDKGYYLKYKASNKSFALFLDSEYSTVNQAMPNITAGTWYHIVAWWDDANLLTGITVNGDIDQTTQSGINGSVDVSSSSSIFVVGGSNVATDAGLLAGQLDSIGFWFNRVLTLSERQFLYNSGNGIEP